ncbi:type IV secretory system conjugative DNA transfer family protein [uncultured Jannaschia sp.]|uniref:type IV secretory system conjugative DNA transfer family protein n=1 Tax=uncultured Jannaschia sp. TaxID=293347 RepID=UPI0026382F93|nr:type IV secretory system conjugative DNA transfer family protein [uncultured Jannaschia sp.]
MIAVLRRGFRGAVTASRWAVAGPALLLMLLGYLAIGTFGALAVGFVIVVALEAAAGIEIDGTFWEYLLGVPLLGIGWIVAGGLWADKTGANLWFRRMSMFGHGSARFATRKERAALQAPDGLLVGVDPETGASLTYDGAAHLLTLAPTRSGKGVGTLIPNLLQVRRSMIVVDPKGENTRITARTRATMGPVHVLDPFGLTGHPSAALNPLDALAPDSPDLGEDAATLAEALVMDPPGQVQESQEADGLIARAANRFRGKSEREAASVLSAAQRHTHFLDSRRIADTLATTDIDFANLKHAIGTVFLVLPPDRLDAYARWLRLLIAQALRDIARSADGGQVGASAACPASPARSRPLRGPQDATGAPDEADGPLATPEALSAPLRAPQGPRSPSGSSDPGPALHSGSTGPLSTSLPPKGPILFLLDEFAALGRLEAVERAMGLMAGYGLQLWPILQDLSQLRALYGPRANTFVANAGVLQCFGVNDLETAEWLSRLLGRETIGAETWSHRPGDPASISVGTMGRELMTPSEVMQLPDHLQLLRLQGRPPILAAKLRYYDDPVFAGLFDAIPR